MNTNRNFREKILTSPSYWVEAVNGILYDSILDFMDKNNMKQKDLARHLQISPSRVSQILNDGEINFSLEKVIDIALKVGKIPSFSFENKEAFLKRELVERLEVQIRFDFDNEEIKKFSTVSESESKVVSLYPKNESKIEMVLQQ